jgi:hypothetical protein
MIPRLVPALLAQPLVPQSAQALTGLVVGTSGYRRLFEAWVAGARILVYERSGTGVAGRGGVVVPRPAQDCHTI